MGLEETVFRSDGWTVLCRHWGSSRQKAADGWESRRNDVGGDAGHKEKPAVTTRRKGDICTAESNDSTIAAIATISMARRNRKEARCIRRWGCFHILVALVAVQATAILCLGFFSHDLVSFENDLLAAATYLDFVGVYDANAKEEQDNDKVRYMDGNADDDLHEMEGRIQRGQSKDESAMTAAGGAGGNENHGREQQEQPQQQQQADSTSLTHAETDRSDSMAIVKDTESSNTSALPPLDDYYRRHRTTFSSSSDSINNGTAVPLIVGGSDGSGTRAFVDVLGQLGVNMLIDDSRTMDIHGSVLFRGKGWPPLAVAVLNEFHSAYYEMANVSLFVQNASTRELGKLRDRLERRLQRLLEREERRRQDRTNMTLNGEAASPAGTTPTATKITYGFKAPVTMLLVPLLRHVFGPIKYLHVVRDGRDVALSSNQSPVVKFYNSTYEDQTERNEMFKGVENATSVKAIQLWNDWNQQLYRWEQDHHNDGFDFLVMRTEDLLNPSTKGEALQQLADFVGSSLSDPELCCLGRNTIKDMGQSHKLGAGDHGQNKPLSRSTRGWTANVGRFVKSLGLEGTDKAFNEVMTLAAEGLEGGQRDTLQQLKRAKMLAAERQRRQKEETGSVRGWKDRRGALRKVIEARRKEKQGSKWGGEHGQQKMMANEHQARGGIGNAAKDYDRMSRRKLLLERQPGQRDRGSERARAHAQRQLNRLEERKKLAVAQNDQLLVGVLTDKIHYFQTSLDRLDGYHDKDKDEGSNGNAEEKSEKAVTSVHQRYGKWVEALRDKPDLSSRLHMEGGESLARFGYEPNRRFMDIPDKPLVCPADLVCEE